MVSVTAQTEENLILTRTGGGVHQMIGRQHEDTAEVEAVKLLADSKEKVFCFLFYFLFLNPKTFDQRIISNSTPPCGPTVKCTCSSSCVLEQLPAGFTVFRW